MAGPYVYRLMKPLLLFLPFFLSFQTISEPGPSVAREEAVNKKLLLQLVNKVRSQGCKCGGTKYAPAEPLKWNEQLERAARTHSNDMQRRNYFDHRSKDGSSAGDRIRRAGYQWSYYAENIAMGPRDEAEVIAGWLNSKGHCANIMNPGLTEMAVSRSGPYWVQVFGTHK